MKILVTGNMGYVGSELVKFLKANLQASTIIGYDTSFFGQYLSSDNRLPESYVDVQYFGDIRNLTSLPEDNIEAVIHLAAISNDPMGKQFENVTHQINCEASVEFAQLCEKSGVANFVFASSCSMYGAAGALARKEQDPKNPLTAYARSKVQVEQDYSIHHRGEMNFTSLRFATACGWSDRLRLDLVLNDFVASAVLSGEIRILSDGSPWRPLIDVQDMCRAMLWGVLRTKENGGSFLCVNAGSNKSNYTVLDLANTVQHLLPKSNITLNSDAPPDKRSYTVDFSLFEQLAPEYLPQLSLDISIDRLIRGIKNTSAVAHDFRSSNFIRLNALKNYIANGLLTDELRWV